MRHTLQRLLCVGLLAGLLAPVAVAQWWDDAEMYIYADLYRSGSVVYGYAETSLAHPDRWAECWSHWGDDCWNEYTSEVKAWLYKDSGLQDMNSDQGWSYEAAAWVSADADVGYWTLNTGYWMDGLDRYDWYWYWEGAYWWKYDFLSDSDSRDLTVNPEVSVSGSQTTWDGDGAYFDVTAEVGTPTWYAWSFDYPSGAGNNPSVQFDPDDENWTYAEGRWFASPDDQCYAPLNSTYDITATVGFESGSLSDATSLTVRIPSEGGHTDWPELDPHVYFVPPSGGGLWTVAPQTYFDRGNAAIQISLPWSSQFYVKVWEHESVHWDQMMPGGNYHLLETFQNPTDARNAVIGLTDSTEQGLINKVGLAIYNYGLNQGVAYVLYFQADAEREAYAVGDSILPDYVYENCGRY